MSQEGKRKYKKNETASEVRKKATMLEKSRDDWKAKNRESHENLKSLKKRMTETKGSRELWRAKCLELEEESRVNKEKITDLETELFKERFEKLALEQRIEKINESIKKKELKENLYNPTEKKIGNATYSSQFKALCVILIISTAIAVRSLSTVLKSLQLYTGLFGNKTPSHTSFRRWLNQAGYYMLEIVPVEQAKDWIFIVDNSIRIENRKLCLVLGVKRSQLKKGKSLSLKDMQVIAMRLIDKNKEVEKVLEEAVKKAGIPVSICSDLGPDVMSSVRGIVKKYEGIQHIPDMTHKAANILKRQLETDKNWNEFITNVNRSKNRLKQSSLSFLCPPNVRGKSRFLNCKDVIIWALRIIQMLESMSKEDVDYEVMNEKLGWAMKEKKDIEYFFELFELAAVAKELTRKLHIDKNVWKYAKGLLKEMSSSSKGKKFADELVAFLKEQGEKVEEGAYLLGCSEIIESAMSKLKLLDRECGNSGYTRSILGLAACFGPIDQQAVARALETVNEKDIKAWAEKHIGQTIQNKRRKALKNLDKKELVEKLDRFIEREIMVA